MDSPYYILPRFRSSCWEVFDSSCNKFEKMDFPELVGTDIRFSKDGWLLISQNNESDPNLFFFNPWTKEKLQLPPTTTCFSSACFSAPPTSSHCSIFGIIRNTKPLSTQFALINLGDPEWKFGWFDNTMYKFWPSTNPPIFHNGVYYCLDTWSRAIMTFTPTEKDGFELSHFSNCHHELFRFHNCHRRDEEDSLWKEEEEYDDEEEEDSSEYDDSSEEEEDNSEYDDSSEEEEDNSEYDDSSEEEEDSSSSSSEEEIIKESYMIQVMDEGEIWGVFVKRCSEVSVAKLDMTDMRWKELESLGNKCLYVSPNGSFAVNADDATSTHHHLANKIFLHKFCLNTGGGTTGVVYSLSSRMYHTLDGTRQSYDDSCVYPCLGYVGAWINPST